MSVANHRCGARLDLDIAHSSHHGGAGLGRGAEEADACLGMTDIESARNAHRQAV